VLRPHRLALGVYDRVGGRLVRRDRLELDVVGSRTEVVDLVGAAQADLILLNEDDLSWTKIRFDGRSMRTVLDGGIGRLDDVMARSLAWSATWHMTRDGELPAGEFIRLVLEGMATEPDVGLIEQTLSWARFAIDALGAPDLRSPRLAALSAAALGAVQARTDDLDLQLVAAQASVAAASSEAELEVLEGWLEERGIPGGLAIDHDLRWRIVNRLAVTGRIADDHIAGELGADQTFAARTRATEARASLPTPSAKAAAWSAVMGDDSLTNHLAEATARGFWHHEQQELGRPYVERYFEVVPSIWRSRTLEMALMLTRSMYPAVMIEQATLERTDAVLAAPDLDPGLRRVLAERRDDVRRALACRRVDIPA